jgi:hypothetical protein
MAEKKMTPKQTKLAAMSGDKKKITRGDVIAAAKMGDSKKGSTKGCSCGNCASCKKKKAGKK